jgi:TRAP transporter TAXI family solute receptor
MAPAMLRGTSAWAATGPRKVEEGLMRNPFGRLIAGALLVLAALSMPLAAQEGDPGSGQPIAIGTMAPGTISHSTGMAVASVITAAGGPELRVVPHSGESLLLDLLATGEIDFAIVNSAEALARPNDGLRVAAVLYPLHVGLLVRDDSELRTVADLRGQRVTTGFATSPGIARLLDALLAADGLTLEDVRPVRVGDLLTGAERFLDGRSDAFFFAVGAAKLIEVNAARPIRLLTLTADAEAEARMQAVVPAAYIAPLAPRPGLVGVDAPTPTLTFDNLLVTRADVSAATVTGVLEALAGGKPDLVDRLPAFAGLDPEGLARAVPGLRMHDATIVWAAQ